MNMHIFSFAGRKNSPRTTSDTSKISSTTMELIIDKLKLRMYAKFYDEKLSLHLEKI